MALTEILIPRKPSPGPRVARPEDRLRGCLDERTALRCRHLRVTPARPSPKLRRGEAQRKGGRMLAMWVKVRVKPEGRERFLKAIEVDALGSERDEPGCLRFNVLQDAQDQNVYYFYEAYRD